jgi:heat shock protein HslJ
MDQETRFFDALDKARSWKIESDVLLLLDAQGNVLVRLAPVQPGASS